jgi:hypothetical protein
MMGAAMPHRSVVVRPLLLALTLALGFGAVWGCAALWGVEIARNLQPDQESYEELYIQMDGTPVILTFKRNYRERDVRTLDGVPVTQFRPASAAPLAAPPQRAFDGLSWPQRLYGFGVPETPPQAWYFLHDGREQGRGYFVGYDRDSQTLLGYIGAHGFQLDLPARDAQFPVDGRLLAADLGQMRAVNQNVGAAFEPDADPFSYGEVPPPDVIALLIANDEMLEINLSKRSLRPLFKEAGLVAVGATMKLSAFTKAEPAKADLLWVARTEDRLLFFARDGSARRSLVLPEELHRQPFTAFELPDRRALLRVFQRTSPIPGDTLYWLGDDPAEMKSRFVPLRTWQAPLSSRQGWWWFAAAAPSPMVLTLSAALFKPLEKVRRGQASDYGTATGEILTDAWPALLMAYLVSSGLAAFCWHWHGRHGGRFALVWVAFVFLFGLPGFVGYLWHRNWPVVAPCPVCGQPAPRDRETCLHCRAAFPRPALRGTEIFG